MESSLNETLLVDYHVVTEVIETKLVICNICNIAFVCFSSVIVCIRVEDNSDSQSEEAVNRTHPLGITLCKVIVNGNDVNALTLKCVKISRKCRNESFTFTCSHLGDTSLMQEYTTDKLNTEMLHSENTLCSFSYNREGFYQEIIECLSILQSLLKLICFSLQLVIRQLLHVLIKSFYLIYDRINPF